MKRLFWSFLLAMGAGIAVWFFSRRKMDGLYTEISRLREYEQKALALDAELAELQEKSEAKEAAYLNSLSSEERIEHELLQARVNSYMKEQLGEELYNEFKS